MALDREAAPNDFGAFRLPLSANRQVKRSPRMVMGDERMRCAADDGIAPSPAMVIGTPHSDQLFGTRRDVPSRLE